MPANRISQDWNFASEGLNLEKVFQKDRLSYLASLEEPALRPDCAFNQVQSIARRSTNFNTCKRYEKDSHLDPHHNSVSNQVSGGQDTLYEPYPDSLRSKDSSEIRQRCLSDGTAEVAIPHPIRNGALTPIQLNAILAADPNLRLNLCFKPHSNSRASSAKWYSSSTAAGIVIGSQRCYSTLL